MSYEDKVAAAVRKVAAAVRQYELEKDSATGPELGELLVTIQTTFTREKLVRLSFRNIETGLPHVTYRDLETAQRYVHELWDIDPFYRDLLEGISALLRSRPDDARNDFRDLLRVMIDEISSKYKINDYGASYDGNNAKRLILGGIRSMIYNIPKDHAVGDELATIRAFENKRVEARAAP